MNVFTLIGAFFLVISIIRGNLITLFIGLLSLMSGFYSSFNVSMIFMSFIFLTAFFGKLNFYDLGQKDKSETDVKRVKNDLSLKCLALLATGQIVTYVIMYFIFIFLSRYNPYTLDMVKVALNSNLSSGNNPMSALSNFICSNLVLIYFIVTIFKPIQWFLDKFYYKSINNDSKPVMSYKI